MNQPDDPAQPFRIYIDTSVLGGCLDTEFTTWSNGLIRDFRAGRLIPVLSDVTAAEATDAPEAVRELHQEMLGLAGSLLPITPTVLELVAAYETRKNRMPRDGRDAGADAESALGDYSGLIRRHKRA
ncbi:MAG: hypothetical protein HY654_05260 [Acidobacteria bacterium]|nr:hypothetical protein [Acidobacteriota bacterium]